MNTHGNIYRLFSAAKILAVVLLVPIVTSGCVPREELFIVPVTDQDIRFLKKCMGEDGTVHIAMQARHRKAIDEIIKSNGSRPLASPYQNPFPATIPDDPSELNAQCYHFVWDGSYAADDGSFE